MKVVSWYLRIQVHKDRGMGYYGLSFRPRPRRDSGSKVSVQGKSDLVYTRPEFEKIKASGSIFIRRVLREGIELL